MSEQHLELNLETEMTFTQQELNLFSQILSFVEPSALVEGLHAKLNAHVDEQVIDASFEQVMIKQYDVMSGSHILPRGKALSMLENGYVLDINTSVIDKGDK